MTTEQINMFNSLCCNPVSGPVCLPMSVTQFITHGDVVSAVPIGTDGNITDDTADHISGRGGDFPHDHLEFGISGTGPFELVAVTGYLASQHFLPINKYSPISGNTLNLYHDGGAKMIHPAEGLYPASFTIKDFCGILFTWNGNIQVIGGGGITCIPMQLAQLTRDPLGNETITPLAPGDTIYDRVADVYPGNQHREIRLLVDATAPLDLFDVTGYLASNHFIDLTTYDPIHARIAPSFQYVLVFVHSQNDGHVNEILVDTHAASFKIKDACGNIYTWNGLIDKGVGP